MANEMCFHLLHFLLFSWVLPIGPFLLPGHRIRDENTGMGSGDEAGKECQAEMKIASQSSVRGVVLPCRPGQPQLMIYGPEGTTKSWMVFLSHRGTTTKSCKTMDWSRKWLDFSSLIRKWHLTPAHGMTILPTMDQRSAEVWCVLYALPPFPYNQNQQAF